MPWDKHRTGRIMRARVEANYYPVVSWIYIRDLERNLQLTLLPDRPQGGTAHQKGTLELMVSMQPNPLLHNPLTVQYVFSVSGSNELQNRFGRVHALYSVPRHSLVVWASLVLAVRSS